MFCTNCGAELPEGSKFCVNCGQPVEPGDGAGEKPEAAAEKPQEPGERPEPPAPDVKPAEPRSAAPQPAQEPGNQAGGSRDGQVDATKLEKTTLLPNARATGTQATPKPETSQPTVQKPSTTESGGASQQYVYCMNCGARNQAGDAFCIECGQRLPQVDAAGNVVDDTSADPASEPYEMWHYADQTQQAQSVEAPPQYADQASQAGYGGADAPRKRSKVPIVIAIVVVVLVVGAGSAFALHYFGYLGPNDPLGFLPQREQATEKDDSKSDEKAEDDSESDDSSSEDEADSSSSDEGTSDDSSSSDDASSSDDQSSSDDSQSDSAAVVEQTKTFTVVHQAMTWYEAEQYCANNGGNLASISSQEEWDEVKALLDQDGGSVYWIGGFRNDTGNFAWYDGSSFSFQAWASGEPNNDGGSENYMAILKSNGNYAWYDVPEDVSSYYKSEKMGFVMETLS